MNPTMASGRRDTLRRVLLIFALATLGPPAGAQPRVPVGIVENACAPPQPMPAAFRAVQEDMLKPGNTFSVDHFSDTFNTPEVQAALKAMYERREQDWPDLCKYQSDNAALAGKPQQAVFMGDSITENWVTADPGFFANGNVGRGISGQTTPQMVLRFYQDVIALNPRIVHIMTGTNDLAGGTGPSTLRDYKNHVTAMLDLAQANHIAVVLAGIPPSRELGWVGIDPRDHIRNINAWLEQTARERGLVFVDYADVLADADGGMQETLSNDGVHPHRDGYARMKPLAESAIAKALSGSRAGVDRPTPKPIDSAKAPCPEVGMTSASHESITETNRHIVERFVEIFYGQKNVRLAFETFVGDPYIQHNPGLADGREAAIEKLEPMFSHPDFTIDVKRILVDGDMAVVHLHARKTPAERGGAVVDMFRLEDGKIVEHWDVIQAIPEQSANAHPMF